MGLSFAGAISSEEVERICSREFDATRFAALCNALSWASAGRRTGSLPSFTERTNVADGGIDAEWQIDLPDDDKYDSPLLGAGWNVFQYKQRDIFTQGREKVFSAIKSDMKGALRELHESTKRRPQRYVLFTNLDLTHETGHYSKRKLSRKGSEPDDAGEGDEYTEVHTAGQKGDLRSAILDGYDDPEGVHVEVVGAAELAALLNDHPHLRLAYFEHNAFMTWEEAKNRYTRASERSGQRDVVVVGRDAEITQLREYIDGPAVRVIVVSGPPDIGKSRLVLEATAHRPLEVVYAINPYMMPTDLLLLERRGTELVVVLEDPDVEAGQRLVDAVMGSASLKLVLTVPTPDASPPSGFGSSESTQLFTLDSLNDEQSKALLIAAEADFDFSLWDWVIQQAGGNPGVLLAAAHHGKELRDRTTPFREVIVRSYLSDIRGTPVYGEEMHTALGLLSLMTLVDTEGEPSKEVELLCKLFGGVHPNKVYGNLQRLTRAGYLRTRSHYVEVVPPILAAGLACDTLAARYQELLILFAALTPAGRSRLVARLQLVKCNEVRRFWHELVGTGGLIHDVPSALSSRALLREASTAVPERVASVIEENLRQLDVDARRAVLKEGRWDLFFAIRELLFHRTSSSSALRIMGLVGEVSGDFFASGARTEFFHCFMPLHPQFPLPLEERLLAVREFANAKDSVALRQLAVEAVNAALTRSGYVTLHTSSGSDPLDTMPEVTNGEVWSYLDAMVDLLMDLARDPEPEVAKKAQEVLPQVVVQLALQARPERALAHLRTLVEWATTGAMPVQIAQLGDGLLRIRQEYQRHLTEVDEERRELLATYLNEVVILIQELENSNCVTQLKRWAGDHSFAAEREHEEVSDSSDQE